MKRTMILLAGLATLLCLGAATPFLLARPEMVSVDRPPVKHIGCWQRTLSKPLSQRIGPASPELVEYLQIDNQSTGYPNIPSAAGGPDDFLADVRDAIAHRVPYCSRFDSVFTLRKDVVYYLGARMTGTKMGSVNEQLEQTNFPTLYAGTSPGDDFAESFAS